MVLWVLGQHFAVDGFLPQRDRTDPSERHARDEVTFASLLVIWLERVNRGAYWEVMPEVPGNYTASLMRTGPGSNEYVRVQCAGTDHTLEASTVGLETL